MKRKKGIGLTLVLIVLLFSLTACKNNKPKNEGPSKETMEMLLEASVLINSVKFKEARELLEDNYNLVKNYDVGLSQYGYIEYHIFEDYDKAIELYERAIKLKPDNATNYYGLGDLYQAKGDNNKAIIYYEKAIERTSKNNNVPFNSQLGILYKSIGESYVKLNDTIKAIEALEKAVENNPYNIEANALLHQLYVKNEAYEMAYNVWKTDNLIDDSGNHVYAGLIEWNTMYKDAAEDTNGRTHLEMGNLYKDLILYDEAVIEYEKAYANDQSNVDIKNNLDEVKAYLTFRDELKSLLNDYYRDRSIYGKRVEQNYYIRIKPAYEKIAPLFPQIVYNSGNDETWIYQLNKEIEEKFSIKIENITANGTMLGLHFGRIIDSSSVHSKLWGEEIDLKVITLKNMVSNGLGDWISIGGSVGGWSISSSEIVRVMINDNSYMIELASLYDEESRANYINQIGASNEAFGEREPLELFYSPVIARGIIFKMIDIEIEKAKAHGVSDLEMQSYLFDKVEKDFNVVTNCIVHESQHSIDNKNSFSFKWFGENEYRTKMAELTYGKIPFMSLHQFYNANIGAGANDTHSRANRQVIQDIVQHIYDNSSKYPQIDTEQNILSQIDKLSEEELKQIAIKVFENKYDVEYDN